MTSFKNMPEIKQHLEAQREQIFTQLKEIVSFNSVHSEPTLLQDYEGAADWTRTALNNAGFEVTAHPADDGTTNFVATRKGADNAPTVLLYSHFDVVPAGPRELWTTEPFTLTEREADVLRMRFGMYDGRTHTLEEVGQIFGVTRERIRQIENKAIRKLRHPSRAKKIKDFYC